jgi:hypothetical protein
VAKARPVNAKGKKDKKSLPKEVKEVAGPESKDISSEEAEDTSMYEWVKSGVGDLVVKSLKEAKFYKPTQIQVRLDTIFTYLFSF